MKRYDAGQTLVEIVISLGIVILLVAGLIVGTTAAIHTSGQDRLRSQSVGYAQEALELTRLLRDNNWSAFASRNGLWCLDQTNTWTQAGLSCPTNIGSVFSRGATFTWNSGASRMEVTGSVSWQDGGVTRQTTITTYFTQWQ